jgi:phytoene dehydrogenase-like protein
MTDAGRIVVIGAGHNGLVAAATLARAGRQVLVLEAAAQVGGAAITREFAPGFRVSAVAHLLHLLDPVVIRELKLARHGLSLARSALATVALADDAEPLVLDGNRVIAGPASAADRSAYRDFIDRMRRFAAVIARQHGRVPPRLAWDGWRDALPAAAFAFSVRRQRREDLREFLRIVTMPVYDVLEESFESPSLKGALALDAVLGTRLGPRSGNSLFTFLYRLSGSVDGRPGALALPRGGMGAVTDALAAAARAAGAEIRVSSPVEAITLAGERVTGVRLASGEQLAAATVASSADPKTTLLKLLGARHLEAELARRVLHLRSTGTAAKLHLALDGVPAFRGVPGPLLGERLVIAPDSGYVDRAFNPAKYRQYSGQPVFEITIPSLHDPSLAPPGQHVLSAIVQYAPADLAAGWSSRRDAFRELAQGVLEHYAPGLRRQTLAAELLTPADIEREFRISGGHWHHAELALDQFLMLRPVPGIAQYALPIEGLYLCGAGCHPGGGVMGTAGRNAARAILAGAARS